MASDEETEVVEYPHYCFTFVVHNWYPIFEEVWARHKRLNEEGGKFYCEKCQYTLRRFRGDWAMWGKSQWVENLEHYDIFQLRII